MVEVTNTEEGRIKKYLYSPAVAARYRVKSLARCEVSVILETNYRHEVWNLFWLSCPQIDLCLDAEDVGNYRPIPGLAGNVIRDVLADVQLINALTKHPHDFLRWFEYENHESYWCFKEHHGTWVDTVIRRAQEAGKRADMKRELNVFYQNFVR